MRSDGIYNENKSPKPSRSSESEEVEEAVTEEALLATGIAGLQAELGLPDDSLLEDVVEIRRLDKRAEVMTESSHNDVALVYIIEVR